MNELKGSGGRGPCWLPSMCTLCILTLTLTSSALGRSDQTGEKREECLYSHPQSQYCMSDFVMRGTVDKVLKSVKDNSSGEWEQKLKFKVQRIYKRPPPGSSTDKLLSRKMVKVWLYNTRPLKVGKDYLIAGEALTKSLKVYRCNWVTEWDHLTRMQYRGIQGRYELNCHCLINTQCLTVSGVNVCKEKEESYNNHIKRSILHPVTNKFEDTTQDTWADYWADIPDDNNDHTKSWEPLSCPVDVMEESKTKMDCFSSHAACYMTTSGNSCRWRTDDNYYTFCMNKDWLQK